MPPGVLVENNYRFVPCIEYVLQLADAIPQTGDQGPIEATFRPLTVELVEILREQVAMSKETPKLIVPKDKYEPHISLNIDIARRMMSWMNQHDNMYSEKD